MPIESLANCAAEVPYGGNLTRVLGSQKGRSYGRCIGERPSDPGRNPGPELVSQGHMRGVLGPTQLKGVCSVNSAASPALIVKLRVKLLRRTGTTCGGKHWVRPARQDGLVLFPRFDVPHQKELRTNEGRYY